MEKVEVTKKDERRPIKFSLKEIFSMEDAVKNLEERRLDKARDVIRRQSKQTILPAAHCLLRYYHALVRTKTFREIPNVVENLFELIQDENQITANVTLNFARRLRDEKKFLDSFLCFLITSKFYERETNTSKSVVNIRKCARELCLTFKSLLECNMNFRSFMVNGGIPEVVGLRGKIRKTEHVDRKHIALQEAFCIHYIYGCYALIEWWGPCLSPLKEGIDLMYSVFREDAGKYLIYGRFLNNLGFVQSFLSLFDKAVKSYRLALDATKKAEDYVTKDEKNKVLFEIEKNLNIALKNQENAKRKKTLSRKHH